MASFIINKSVEMFFTIGEIMMYFEAGASIVFL